MNRHGNVLGNLASFYHAAAILKSGVFPALWLDAAALLRGDMPRVLAGVQQGTASAEHDDFVGRLQGRLGQA